MKTMCGGKESYIGPTEAATDPAPAAAKSADLLPTRQLWVGRDTDMALYMYPSHPVWTGSDFMCAMKGQFAANLPEEWFPDLEPGMCQAFVRQGARVDKRKEPEPPAAG